MKNAMERPSADNTFYKIAFLLACILLGFIAYESQKVKTPPFWYRDSQIGWEMDHKITPKGYDDVSRAIIDLNGVRVVPWKKEQFWATSANADTRYQWIDDKLLVRSQTGKMGVFVGGGTMHPPLKKEPSDETPLLECLDPADDGHVLPTYQRGMTLIESMRASGANVIEAK
jgi:hypothetical protein